MKTAIMQPYLFPYVGYFQLVYDVDNFVFFDDVNYIKRGWINRNQILINGQSNFFSVPVVKASQNKLIFQTEINLDKKWIKKFYSTLEFNYGKAPFFDETFKLIKNILFKEHKTISDLASFSIEEVSKYLELSTVFEKSSISYKETKGMEKADRLIEITKKSGAKKYINLSGGKALYEKEYFLKKGIELYFIENKITPYKQYKNYFVRGLSIIDVLMFNPKDDVIKMLKNYKLV